MGYETGLERRYAATRKCSPKQSILVYGIARAKKLAARLHPAVRRCPILEKRYLNRRREQRAGVRGQT
jgi:hypothetical protein